MPRLTSSGSGQRARPDAGARASARLALALVGAAVLAVVLGTVALLVHDAWGPLVRLDLSTSAAAEDAVQGSPALLAAARVLTHLGDPVLVTVVTVLVAGVLLRRGRVRPAVFLLVGRAGALLLSQGTKAAVGRARPSFEDPVASAFGASFPSGHALGGSVFWLTLALVLLPRVRRRRLLLAGALLVALVVCATRVLLGVHYLSDVTAGLLVGVAWTAVCASLFALWRAEEGAPVDGLEDGVADSAQDAVDGAQDAVDDDADAAHQAARGDRGEGAR